MIRIADAKFKRKTPMGQVLDHASIEDLVINRYQNRVGSPMLRTRMIWGVAVAGCFVAHSYDDYKFAQDFYVQASVMDKFLEDAGAAAPPIVSGAGADPADLVMYWVEQYLVRSGALGEGAELIAES